uniref:CCHC-type domain-containing protein n=1 Tax=Oryza meridionalis TaxID=40149 RepID=A0A0E0D3C4_9ORYZ
MEIMQQLAAAATALCPPEPSPTAMTTAQVEAAIATLHCKKQRLREAYDSLVLHSPIPLPFRWSDLDSHLSSLQSSIHARFSQLQALQASRPASPAAPAAAASHGEDVQEQGEDEVMAAAKMAPPSTVQVKEEPVEAAACASMEATRLSSNPAGKRAGVGQDEFVRPGGMAAPAAAKMAPASKVQVKEEPVEVSPSPPVGATGLTVAACASMDAARLTDVCKRAGGGGQGFSARNGSGTAQSPPIPSCPVLQQQHTAGAPNGSHPVLRQHAANAMNAGHSAAFRPQQHMGKPRDAGDLQRRQQQQRVHANLTCPLPPQVVAGSSPPLQQQRVGVFPSPPPPSQARVGEANLTNPLRQQFTASAPHAGDGQLQKRPPWQLPQRVGVANPMNAGDLPPQKPQFTANATNAGEHPFQEQQQPPPVAKPTDAAAGDLLPQQQQQQLMANAPNAGEHLLPEQQKQQPVTAAKPANAPPLQHAANATNPAVLRRQRQRQWVRLRPPTATNLPQTKQEQHHRFMADDGANARNPLPPPPPCGMAKPPNSGDLPTDQNNHQLMANTHSAPTPVSTPLVASNQSESSAMTTTTTNSNQNSGGGRTGPQPVAVGAAPNPAGNQQQGQRKGGANRRGGRGQGNKSNNVANTNISYMSKVIGKGNKGQCNGNPQLSKNGNPQFNKNVPGDHHQKNKNAGQLCYRCGCRGHWSRICRTPEHLVKLYQQDRKAKLQAGANTNTVYVGAMTD